MNRKNRRPRKNNRKRNGNKPRFTDTGITTVSFSGQLELSFNNGSGVVAVDIFPRAVSFCQRFTDVSSSFKYYRIVAFEYFFIPSTKRVEGQIFAHALLPQDSNALPVGNFAQLCQLPATKLYDSRMITLQRNKLGRRALLQQPTKWWTCNDLQDTEDDYIQCRMNAICQLGPVDNTIMWFFKFVVEYRSAAIEYVDSPVKPIKEKHQDCPCLKCTKNS